MLKSTVQFVSILLFSYSLATASMALPQQAQKPLTNHDVVKMMKGGLPEGTIVSAIQANSTNFNISADALIALQKAGVAQPVMDAMIAAESNKRTAGSRVSTGVSGGNSCCIAEPA
jgi:hypothetical protein